MAAAKGPICIYDETNTLVYEQMARSGDYDSTVTLQGNKLTFSVTSENTVVYVTDNDEILTNTKNITVVSTPVGAVTQTVITLPIEPSTVKLATGTSEIDEYSGYIELAQGETKTTAYGAGMNTGGGAVIYYTSGGVGSTLTFKHFYDAGTIGSGTVKFRHYSQTEPIPQLATPQNVAASGTTVSWDAVENATSYEIFADGTSIGTVEGAATNLISFTIDGTSYQAEEGMTWVDWVASSYNTGGFYIIEGNTSVKFSNGTDYVSSEGFSGGFANNTSQIVANGTYYKFSSGGDAN